MVQKRYDYEQERERRSNLRRKLERRRHRRDSARKMMMDVLKLAGVILAAVAVIILVVVVIRNKPWENGAESLDTTPVAVEKETQSVTETELAEPEVVQVGDVYFKAGLDAVATADTVTIPKLKKKDKNYIDSKYIVLINEKTGKIVAQRKAKKVISPASMTKVLTVLVAAEHLKKEDLDKKEKITIDITDYIYQNGCSAVNFALNEKVPVRDLFYGTILPSGADAALALANYVAGSHENFVAMMNEKLKELGLSATAHVTNCIGLYDKDHHCTVYDMAVIMKAALQNDLCREVLSKHTYTTTKTKKHKDGITISNWFLRRIEDHPCGGLVVAAKTGYVAEARNCAVSYEIADSKTPYICVTATAKGGWQCIYDHVSIYQQYAK